MGKVPSTTILNSPRPLAFVPQGESCRRAAYADTVKTRPSEQARASCRNQGRHLTGWNSAVYSPTRKHQKGNVRLYAFPKTTLGKRGPLRGQLKTVDLCNITFPTLPVGQLEGHLTKLSDRNRKFSATFEKTAGRDLRRKPHNLACVPLISLTSAT